MGRAFLFVRLASMAGLCFFLFLCVLFCFVIRGIFFCVCFFVAVFRFCVRVCVCILVFVVCRKYILEIWDSLEYAYGEGLAGSKMGKILIVYIG